MYCPDVKCSMETCVGMSSGTASLMQVDYGGGANGMDDPIPMGGRGKQSPGAIAGAFSNNGCRCQCIQPMPVFRDDLRICVDDLQGEC